MKLLFSLLFLIIIIVLVYNFTVHNKYNISNYLESSDVKYMNLTSERTIPRIRYNKDGVVNTLPVVNKLPLNYIKDPVIRKEVNDIKLMPNELQQKENVDLLMQNEFNMDKMNPNRWNYGNLDFAPYIDGTLKQNTNNYVPGFKFNGNRDYSTIPGKALHNVKINAWRNKSDENRFLVQCS